MLAAGGRSVADMAALRDQPELFGDVASAPTIWRAVHEVDKSVLTALRVARATVREVAWAAGGAPEEVVLDVDASLVEIHSENKEGATSHDKRGFGFHPMFCFLDATGEALAGTSAPATPLLTSWPWSTTPSASCRLRGGPGTDPGSPLTRWSTRCWCGPTPPAQPGASSTGSWPATAAAWMELVLTAADLLAWCQLICLDGDLARAEPRTLRYRLLHTAGRLVRRSRQVILRLPEHWPWSNDLAIAYQRLALLNT